MSKSQGPKFIPLPREQLPQERAPKTSQERPAQNSQKGSSRTAGSSSTVWRSDQTHNLELLRDEEMPQNAHPAQKVPEQVKSPPTVTGATRPLTIPELQWDIMQELHNKSSKRLCRTRWKRSARDI